MNQDCTGHFKTVYFPLVPPLRGLGVKIKDQSLKAPFHFQTQHDDPISYSGKLNASLDFIGLFHWFPVATDRIAGPSLKVDGGFNTCSTPSLFMPSAHNLLLCTSGDINCLSDLQRQVYSQCLQVSPIRSFRLFRGFTSSDGVCINLQLRTCD